MAKAIWLPGGKGGGGHHEIMFSKADLEREVALRLDQERRRALFLAELDRNVHAVPTMDAPAKENNYWWVLVPVMMALWALVWWLAR